MVTNNIRNAVKGGKLAFFLWSLCATRADVAPDVLKSIAPVRDIGTNIHRVPDPRSDAEITLNLAPQTGTWLLWETHSIGPLTRDAGADEFWKGWILLHACRKKKQKG